MGTEAMGTMHEARRIGVVPGGAFRYPADMLRILRASLLMLVVLGLAFAGPVQANCASPPAAATSCSGMTMDEDVPEPSRPDTPSKACTIVQCPTAPPAVAEPGRDVSEPTSHPVRPLMAFVRTITSADPAPEQRPPIS